MMVSSHMGSSETSEIGSFGMLSLASWLSGVCCHAMSSSLSFLLAALSSSVQAFPIASSLAASAASFSAAAVWDALACSLQSASGLMSSARSSS